jgi:hypothetical protein
MRTKPNLKRDETLKKLDMHAPPNWEETISRGELARLLGAGDQAGIHVVIGDIRGSTHLMREATSSREYAMITMSFTERMKKIKGKLWLV